MASTMNRHAIVDEGQQYAKIGPSCSIPLNNDGRAPYLEVCGIMTASSISNQNGAASISIAAYGDTTIDIPYNSAISLFCT
eukprot:UN07441